MSDVEDLLTEQVLGDGVQYQNTKLNLTSPEFGSPVEWRQD